MMKTLGTLSILVCIFVGQAQADLKTIGTATYNGSDYRLIWDDDNNGNSVVWLDYTKGAANWATQNAWAAGLDGSLTYNIDPGYTINWDDDAWRLPTTVNGNYSSGHDGTTTGGYNITTSEMGHLFYVELGNRGERDIGGSFLDPHGLTQFGEFGHFHNRRVYWSGTEYINSNYAWVFDTFYGITTFAMKNPSYGSKQVAMAIRSGDVSAVPTPSSFILGGLGLGMVGWIKKRKAKTTTE